MKVDTGCVSIVVVDAPFELIYLDNRVVVRSSTMRAFSLTRFPLFEHPHPLSQCSPSVAKSEIGTASFSSKLMLVTEEFVWLLRWVVAFYTLLLFSCDRMYSDWCHFLPLQPEEARIQKHATYWLPFSQVPWQFLLPTYMTKEVLCCRAFHFGRGAQDVLRRRDGHRKSCLSLRWLLWTENGSQLSERA